MDPTTTTIATTWASDAITSMPDIGEGSSYNMNVDGNDRIARNAGGIGWAGSLVGSKNPNNLGYRYSTPSKRYRFAQEGGADDSNRSGRDLPSNIQVCLRNRQGQALQNHETLDLPTQSSVEDLNALIHTLLCGGNENVVDDDNNQASNHNKIPYAFYAQLKRKKSSHDENALVDDVEVTTTLADLLQQQTSMSTEHVLTLIYQPLAVLRVRPVTRCTDTLTGHTEAVLHVQYAPTGTLLASGGGDAIVRFWDVHTATPKFPAIANPSPHRDHVLCTAWSPDGYRFVSADKRGVLIVWDPFGTAAMTSDMMVSGTNDLTTTTTTTTTSSIKGSSLKAKKAAHQPPHKRIQAHKKWITSLAFEPMHLVKPRTRSDSGSLGIQQQYDCERLVTASKDATAKIWNLRTLQCLQTLSGHADSVEAIKWSGQGLIYTASRDRTIKVWNPDRGILIRTLTGHGHRINTLALSTDTVLRTGPFDHLHSSGKKRKFVSSKEAFESAKEKYETFCREQGVERLLSGSDDFTLFLWHPSESKHAVKRLTGHQQAVNHIAFSPDGRYVASASFDKKVKLWNGLSGDFLATLTGHVGAVYQVAWSPDSRYLVSASKDSTAKLWQVPSGKRAQETLPGHADEVYALDWSPTGSGVATGSKDRTLKIWKH